MPFGFPSHQGLILPLWRRYPRHFDGLALCVGALMPDVVDGAAYFYRGELGQWLGHSLVGVAAVCVPVGLALTWLARRCLPRAVLLRLDDGAPPNAGSLPRAAASMLVGTLSHVFFDLISHKNFLLLWPWYTNDHLFPDWWTVRWGEVSVPIYKTPYALAPHSLVWGVLSVLGVWLFVRCLRPRGVSAIAP